MVVKQAVVNGRVKGLKTDYSEDELPLDLAFATILLRWKAQCPLSDGDWVFPSPITGRCYHASPIRLHSACGREGGSRGRYRMAYLQAHLPFLAGCDRRTDRRAAKIDAARTSVNHDEYLWERLDEVQAQGEQQSGAHGTSSRFAANQIETGLLAQPRFKRFLMYLTLIGPFWTCVGNV